MHKGLLTVLGVAALTPWSGPRREPLLRYLQIGSARVAFDDDTIVRSGRRIALAAATFRTVRAALGAAEPSDTGDASASYKWICYRLAGAPAMSLILGSTEMGGGNYITNFSYVPRGTQPTLERRCRQSDISPAQLRTDLGLRLGLTRTHVQRILKVAGRDSADVIVYEQDVERHVRNRQGKTDTYLEASGFNVQFRDGRVIGFSGWRLDST